MVEQIAGLLERSQGQLRRRQSSPEVVLIGRQLVDVRCAEALVDAEGSRERGTVANQIVAFTPFLGERRRAILFGILLHQISQLVLHGFGQQAAAGAIQHAGRFRRHRRDGNRDERQVRGEALV